MLDRTLLRFLLSPTIGITLQWNRGTSIYLSLDPSYSGKVCGLCGNFNGQGTDDFTTRQGDLEFAANVFGHSWRVDQCVMPLGPVNPCDINPERKKWAEFSCGIIKQGIFSQCHSAVSIHL